MQPEEKARLVIDKKLSDSGWVIQDYKDANIHASLGVAIREFPTSEGDEVDYALFIDCEPVGIIEAKRDEEGVNLINDAHTVQNPRYIKAGLKYHEDEKEKLRFIYEATSILTYFTDLKDPDPKVRKVFSFHRPETLKKWIEEFEREHNTLRGRLLKLPELPPEGFYDCQINAINNLDKSFQFNRQRALIHMATGAGKTITAITTSYRLLKFAKAKRILFLVDTKQLGEQAETEYKNLSPYDTTSKLADIYKVNRIQHSFITSDTQICISTIQRLYSMLRGEIASISDDVDEDTQDDNVKGKREIEYNKNYPPEFFDFVIIDECHRSIYNVWRQVVEYFDAFLIGLTATPNQNTYAFFERNVVSEYTHEDAKRDGVNVGALGTYYIETQITKNGGVVERIDKQVEVRDKRTRQQKWEEAEEDIDYSASELDRSVVNKSQIELIFKTFSEHWREWEYFKSRQFLPKTLVFAKDDSHADDIVSIIKEVFGKGDDFCKKITYKSEEDSESMLYKFRHEFNPRIAVTVNKISTGTDVKAIEILVFMRDIRNENYYEQMLGRARRTMSREELNQCTPDANSKKLGYVIIDAVGVTKSPKTKGGSKCGGDPKPTVPFKTLLSSIAAGDISDETLTAAGNRLQHLENVMTDKELEDFKKLTNGLPLKIIAYGLLNVYNEDEIQKDIKDKYPAFIEMSEEDQKKARKSIIKERAKNATSHICNPKVREFLFNISNSSEQTIDPAIDKIISQGFSDDVERNKKSIRLTFKEFLGKYQDEITALQIIYNQDYRNRQFTEKMIKDLYEKMIEYNKQLNEDMLFYAYEDSNRKHTSLSKLIDIIQIIKYEVGQITEIYPFADHVHNNYREWIFNRNKNKNGARGIDSKPFTQEQLEWLELIRDYISVNGGITPQALRYGKFLELGGGAKFRQIFGSEAMQLINELNYKLTA